MRQTVFKKLMVSDRLPKESETVYTNLGELKFYKGTGDFTIINKTKIHGSDDRFPKWWLEEIEQDDPEQIKRQLITKQNHLSYMMKNMVIWDKKENKVIDLLKHYKECVDSHTESQKEFSKMVDELLEELG